MSTHTPGPWYCHNCGRIVDGHDLVAAAARDLLVALKTLLTYEADGCFMANDIIEARAAIQKAEGGDNGR